MMRLFFAIMLPESFGENVATRRTLTGLSKAGFRTVPTGALHITLRFVGEVMERELGAYSSLGQSVRSLPMELTCGGELFCLPNDRQCRVVAAPLRMGSSHAALLAAQMGYDGRRPYLPHVTLARRGERSSPLPPLVLPDYCWRAEYFSLMESTLSPHGARYREIERFLLS